MTKLNTNTTSSRRKQRKAHFGATSVERRERMASPLAADLRNMHGVRSMPIKKGDEVKVIRGKFSKDFKNVDLKVVACYRKKYVVHVEKCTTDKANGQTVFVGIDASNLCITKLDMTGSRAAILKRRKITKGD